MIQHSLMFVYALSTISIVTIIFWTLCYPVYLLLNVLGLSSKLPRSQQIGCRLHKFGASWLLWMCGVKVYLGKKSAERLEKFANKNVIYVFNHSTNLDPFILTSALPANVRFIHKRELTKVPLLGQALYCSGHISVDRADRSKAIEALKGAEDYVLKPVHEGGSIALAPEGTRTRDGKLVLPFKKGPFHISKNTQAVLVPVLMKGGHNIFPPGSLVLKPSIVSMKVLDELDPKKFKDDVDDMKDALEKIFIEGLKDENWTAGDVADKEKERPVSANFLFPVLVFGITYKVAALVISLIWK
jgi:1-acyl-sn-glycerol-3-phosphate acyltransferase